MNREERHNLWDIISTARKSYEESLPPTHNRRPQTCPKCNTVGSLITGEPLTVHVKREGRLIEQVLPGTRECRFCYYVEDTV